MEEQCAGTDQHLHVILFNVDDYDVNGAIPSRYANITKTAESLRYLAHSTGGRFHWFRETGEDRGESFAFSIFGAKFSFPILSELVFLLTVFLHIFLYNITPSQLGVFLSFAGCKLPSSIFSLLHLLSHVNTQCRHLFTQCNLEWYSFYENNEKTEAIRSYSSSRAFLDICRRRNSYEYQSSTLSCPICPPPLTFHVSFTQVFPPGNKIGSFKLNLLTTDLSASVTGQHDLRLSTVDNSRRYLYFAGRRHHKIHWHNSD